MTIERERSAALPASSDALEGALRFALRAAQLPAPEQQWRFMRGCCGHPAGVHPLGGRFAGTCRVCDTAHEFVSGRRWRFDFAWHDARLAVEVDGGTFSGGRHTRGAGYERDAEKGNEAVILGWRVLHVTAAMINDGRALDVIERALNTEVKKGTQDNV